MGSVTAGETVPAGSDDEITETPCTDQPAPTTKPMTEPMVEPLIEASVDDALPVLSLILPTFNEAENIVRVLERLMEALRDVPAEVIVVDDDSPDETWRVAREWAEDRSNVRVIRRTTDRGLSSAVLAGMQIAQGAVLGVMDADGQHDERILPDMVARVQGGADICVGSRAVDGGGYGEWSKPRRFASWVATQLAQTMLKVNSSDPMSGFFVVSREHYEATVASVNPRGFKILLEFLTRGSPAATEVGYVFRTREFGETKLTGGVIVDYLLALVELRFGLIVSAQFVRYALVGSTGMIVNLIVFLMAWLAGVEVAWSVMAGIIASVVFNFSAHNVFSFRPTAYRGRHWLRGLTVYGVFSLYGLIVQAAVFTAVHPLFVERFDGEVLPGVLANAGAIALAAVANYLLHEQFTWGRLGLEISRPHRVQS